MDEPPEEGSAREAGLLSVPFARGALLLRAADGELLRLSWGEVSGVAEDPAERVRAVPPGEYALVGYRILAEDAGTSWHISGSAPSIETLRVRPGVRQRVDIDESIRIQKRVARGRVQVSVTGHEGAGLSIYKDGRRIPLRFQGLDRTGRVLASGEIEYG